MNLEEGGSHPEETQEATHRIMNEFTQWTGHHAYVTTQPLCRSTTCTSGQVTHHKLAEYLLSHMRMYWCQVGSSPRCSLLPYESNPFNYRDVAEAKHIRHLRFILGGFNSDVFSAQTHQELMSLIPRKWQLSSHYMVYNGTPLSPRSTVHGLHLQDDQVGDIYLTLRVRGGGNLCECGDRESLVQSPTTRKHKKTSSWCTREEAAAGEDAEIEAQAEIETEAVIETELSIAQFADLRSAPNMRSAPNKLLVLQAEI